MTTLTDMEMSKKAFRVRRETNTTLPRLNNARC